VDEQEGPHPLAQVDNRGPLRAGVDDIQLTPLTPPSAG